MLIFNLILLVLSLVLSLLLVKYFIQDTLLDSKRFKLYALRDRLAYMVVHGEITESDERYEFLMETINNALKFYSRDFSVTIFIKMVLNSADNCAEKQKFDQLIESMKNNKNLNEITTAVFSEFLINMKKNNFFYKNTLQIENSYIYLKIT